ncbi:MAG: phospholipid carrier-dependent glycosyltransferase, partial [Odoribacter sp.]|nr:phospholipid carrier-dependent glycosyltransferase [Odoribacter sp.]
KFFLESGIWALFLITALIVPYWKKRVDFKKEYFLTVSWTFGILVLLSFLPEKKTRYLLPILIPSAMVVAHILFYWYEKLAANKLLRGRDKLFFRINTLLIACIASCLPVGIYVYCFVLNTGVMGWIEFLFVAFLFLLAAGILFRAALKIRPLPFLGGVVFLFFIVEVFLLPFVATLFNNPDMKSIKAVRDMEALQDVAFYYPEDEELRIELVYEAGRRILPLSVSSDTLPVLPMVLVSARSADEVLSDSLKSNVNMTFIGKFDDNRRKTNTKWHSDIFVRNVTLLEMKKVP